MEVVVSIFTGASFYMLNASLVWATTKRMVLLSWLLFAVYLSARLFSIYTNEYLDVKSSVLFHLFPFGIFCVLLVNSAIVDKLDTNRRLILLAVLMLLVIPGVTWLIGLDSSRIEYSLFSSLNIGAAVLLTCFVVWSDTKIKIKLGWVFVLLLAALPIALIVALTFGDVGNGAFGFAMMFASMMAPLLYYFPLVLVVTFLWRRVHHNGRVLLLAIAFTVPYITGAGPGLPYFGFAAHSIETKQKDAERARQSAKRVEGPACKFDNLSLPENTVVYAAGGSHRKELGFQIDQSGNDALIYKVTVNVKSAPVALVLSEYNPAMWDISWTKGTEIKALLVSGYHGQVVAGVPVDLPVLISTQDNNGKCGYFYMGQKNGYKMHSLPHSLFGTGITATIESDKEGVILIGDELRETDRIINSPDNTVESYRNSSLPLAGKRGLDDALRKGILRQATKADVERWVEEKEADLSGKIINLIKGKPKYPKPHLFNAYVVLKEFTMPAGLYGGNSALFIVEKGVQYPEGDRGHSHVFDFNSLECTGC